MIREWGAIVAPDFCMDDAKKDIDGGEPGKPLTRRAWLLSLGSAIVLAGTSGELAAAREASDAAQAAGAPLPPGLYWPSADHLTHALTGDDAFLPIPPGAETEYVQPRSGPFVPQAFSPEEFAVVRRLVEIILGEDLKELPERPAAGAPATIYDEVAGWIDLIVAAAPGVRRAAKNLSREQRALAVAYFGSEEPVRELETYEPERVSREGLAWLGEESQRRFVKDFLRVDPAVQLELVQAISDARPDKSSSNPGTRLFDFLKAETIRGFYTSQLGLKELEYKGNAFYPESPGCNLTPSPQTISSKPE